MIGKLPMLEENNGRFPYLVLVKRVREPLYNTKLSLEIQITRSTATVTLQLPASHTDLSGLVKQDVVYVLRTAALFLRPAYLRENVVSLNRSGAAQRIQIQGQYQHERHQW